MAARSGVLVPVEGRFDAGDLVVRRRECGGAGLAALRGARGSRGGARGYPLPGRRTPPGVISPSSRRICASSSCSRSAVSSFSSGVDRRDDLVEDEPQAADQERVEDEHGRSRAQCARSSFSRMLTKLYGGHGPVYLNVSLS